jgi:two-component system, NtrC family, nitrogen regulation sensor histidine kinase GlnL
MSKTKQKPASEKPTKAHHVFPAPEWTALSSTLAASLAHEIRNPLLSIKGAAQLLEQVVEGDDKSLAQLIINEAARIENLIATMDPLTPNPSQVAIAMNIHEVTEYARVAASSFAGSVNIMTHYDPSLPDVAVVREPLIQALINLIKNSVEALSQTKNPQVIIATRYLIGEHMQRPDGGKLPIQLSIIDNGSGVAADVVPRLFTPFSSSKENGKGLGLAIVAKIIEEHGGLIAYDAPPDGGARFSIYLPVA